MRKIFLLILSLYSMDWLSTAALTCIKTISLTHPVRSLAWHPQKHFLAIGCSTCVQIFTTTTWTLYRELCAADTVELAWSPNGKYLACGCDSDDDTVLTVWEESELLLSASINWWKKFGIDGAEATAALGGVTALAWDPTGNYLASGFSLGKVRIWDLVLGKKIGVFSEPDDPVSSLQWDTEGNYLFAGFADAGVKVWGSFACDLVPYTSPTNDLPDSAIDGIAPVTLHGRHLAAYTTNNRIKVWDKQTWEICAESQESVPNMRALAFSADGNFLVSGAGKELKVWKL